MENDKVPGKGAAITSLVLGIIAIVLWFPSLVSIYAIFCPILSLILGIIGIVFAGRARKQGYTGGIRTAGFVFSLIGLIGGIIFIICCVLIFGVFIGVEAA